MSFLKRFALILWRIWFYLLCSIPVIFFFPILAIVIFLPNGYNIIFWYARNIWASFILTGMGFYIKKYQIPKLDEKQSYLLVANHSSYIDPFVMLRLFKTPFVFVGKKELDKIPFFGFLYKRAAILVDRSKKESRFAVYGKANNKLDMGYSVCIFPEKEYVNENNILNEFKHGAFKLAIAHKLPVLPMVFYDCKRKFPWYTTHGYPGYLRVTIFNPIQTKDLKAEDYKRLMEDTRLFIQKKLIADPQKAAIKAVEVWKKMKS